MADYEFEITRWTEDGEVVDLSWVIDGITCQRRVTKSKIDMPEKLAAWILAQSRDKKTEIGQKKGVYRVKTKIVKQKDSDTEKEIELEVVDLVNKVQSIKT